MIWQQFISLVYFQLIFVKDDLVVLNRKKVVLLRNGAKESDKPAPLSPAEGLACVWDLTAEVYSLTGKHDVESRLQRNVVAFVGKKR
ncbi:MAG TPA: hypothetical protein PKJ68_06390 [Candidatus Woesebacteria bacterium]|nr:hypothetical protein [Candidatus Woesebacteria bacterium]